MHRAFERLDHRPWQLPRGPWVMAQNWHDLLFAHWPVEDAVLRKIVPGELQIDTFARQAWISVVPFRMSGVRLRGTPALPWLSAFPELNVRTYVTCGGKPGVWFFSLDAANPAAVKIARWWFHLPYFHAEMKAQRVNGGMEYSSRRRSGDGAELVATYAAKGASFQAKAGTIEYFLTERYCLYARRTDGVLLRGEIHHAPWVLQDATVRIATNRMTTAIGIELSASPALMHSGKLQQVVVWRPQRVTSSG
jgi:uncharacterized protein YqjF (DUF2071 family)